MARATVHAPRGTARHRRLLRRAGRGRRSAPWVAPATRAPAAGGQPRRVDIGSRHPQALNSRCRHACRSVAAGAAQRCQAAREDAGAAGRRAEGRKRAGFEPAGVKAGGPKQCERPSEPAVCTAALSMSGGGGCHPGGDGRRRLGASRQRGQATLANRGPSWRTVRTNPAPVRALPRRRAGAAAARLARR